MAAPLCLTALWVLPIDADPIESLSVAGTLDSGLGASEGGSSCASPSGPMGRKVDGETVD